ncbi:lactoylglutathione lyase [Exophiala mesophila]|uniref:Lactoylglutathione lyase n=1 Tax=Exophiala mesophila TaxID=212818 RepID=A0A0D1XLT5_EXOME|nr:lactoylglutathione lyase [Exophiala mesophila]KIV89136.1 lactoylglutathione lyase [Exophiala mesophila]
MSGTSNSGPVRSVGVREIPETLTPVTPATQGSRLHHAMLRISDPERSLHFYTDFLGMSLIFKLDTGPFTVYYLGYPDPDDQTPADLAKGMASRTGFLELVYVHLQSSKQEVPPIIPATVGFGHLGWYVADVEETLKRAQENGYIVVKDKSNLSITTMDLPKGVAATPCCAPFLASFAQIGFIRDPDGNSIELLPLQWKR